MEDAPTVITKENSNENRKETGNENENEIKAFAEGDGEELYEIDFLKKTDKILIKCHDTSSENEISYSYKLTIEEIRKTTSCYSITHFFNKIQEFIDSLKIEKMGNFFLLHILLDRNNKQFKTFKLEEGYEDEELEENINNLGDAIKVIKILIKENKILKNKLNSLENEFMEYKNKMALNFSYNSLDINSFKLDNVYKTLSCRDIIKNRDEFGLINSGFQHLFKKNIIAFECIFKSLNNEYNYYEFSNIFKDYKFLVIVILTKDKKRFGAFFENFSNGNNNNNNYNNQMNMGAYQANNQNYSINTPNANIFISTSILNDYFVFSLDELKIFYGNNQNGNIPQFSILYDENRQSLFGQESQINNLYKLSGKQQFNIRDFELYNVEIGKL